MDVGGLRECITATLNADVNIRRQAELRLKHAEPTIGFSEALMKLLGSDPEPQMRLSAVIYLKNKCLRSWEPSKDSGKMAMSEEEKAPVRNGLIPALVGAPQNVAQQIVSLIQKILDYEFPSKWPNFLEITLALLRSNELPSVYAGVQCLLALCRVYRFRPGDKREDLDKIVIAAFPSLLDLARNVVGENSTPAGDLLKLILKTYKHAIYLELPAFLQEQPQLLGWATLFINVVSKEPPQESMSEDIEQRDIHPWWKCKKWSYSNLNRLFVRYGNNNSLQSSSDQAKYERFSKMFMETYAPEILTAYLQQIDLWAQEKTWLSRVCISLILAYLDECVKPKTTWLAMKPHVDNLISHVIFPNLCLSDDDLELFQDEPQEYLHRKINYYEEISAPDIAATNFLVTLTKTRKKMTFSALNFINEIVNKYEQTPDEEKQYRQKEGALRMIGSLSSVILGKNSPIKDKVEYFFVRHVFPEFRSPHGFLRARACEVMEKFAELDFHDPDNIVLIYQNLISCMQDKELPVQIEAALALQPLIRHEYIRVTMQETIPQIMQQLLKLSNQVDIDALSNVMEEFVEVYATELTPYAVELTEQLRDTYLRIINEVVDKNNSQDDDYDEYFDDKSITALGVLQTIGTLILTLESTPEVLHHLETILVPVITTTLQNNLYDLYNEIFEIIDSCTFSAKSISSTMWLVFDLMHKTFKSRADVYIEEMLPALDNYVSYGSEFLCQNPAYLAAIFDIIDTIFTHDKLGNMDRICGCKLAEAVLLHLRGHVDVHLDSFVTMGMQCLQTSGRAPKSYRIHLLEMVINCIYYDPAKTLLILERHGWTNEFFSNWFNNITNMARVHDKKLSIVAIVALLSLPADQVPPSVQAGWPKLLPGIARLFDTLPTAVRNRELQSKEELNFEGGYEDAGSENEWDENGNDMGDAEAQEGQNFDGPTLDQDISDPEAERYMGWLSQEADKIAEKTLGEFGGDDDLEEESLLETPLDTVEPYVLFRDALAGLQQSQPQLYSTLTASLRPDEQQVIEVVLQTASKNEAVLAQKAAEIVAKGI